MADWAPCDPWLSGTDQWAMKPPGAGRWQSMPERVPRQGGPCRPGGPSSGNVVGVSWWSWGGEGEGVQGRV